MNKQKNKLLIEEYELSRVKSSEKGYVAQPLALAYMLLSDEKLKEGLTESKYDDLFLVGENGERIAVQVKNKKKCIFE